MKLNKKYLSLAAVAALVIILIVSCASMAGAKTVNAGPGDIKNCRMTSDGFTYIDTYSCRVGSIRIIKSAADLKPEKQMLRSLYKEPRVDGFASKALCRDRRQTYLLESARLIRLPKYEKWLRTYAYEHDCKISQSLR